MELPCKNSIMSRVINGVELVSNYLVDLFQTDVVSYTFNAFEIYDIRIDWVDFGGPGGLRMSWDLGSGVQVIPDENYAISQDIGTSPLQISVTCTEKYEEVTATTDQCQPICGDGFVISPEVCDDNDTTDGNGCQGDCGSVSFNYVCTGGSPTSQSNCVE